MTKLYCSATLGLVLGYLSGYNLYFSSSIVRLSILIFFVSLLFIKKVKHDIWLRYVLHVTMIFLLLFIYGNIVGHFLSYGKEAKSQIMLNSKAKIKEINIKDSSKILEVEFEDKNLLFKSAAVYTFTNNDFKIDQIIDISGTLTDGHVILPKDKETDFKSFDLTNFWRTKGLDGVIMNAKISTTSLDLSETKSIHSLNYFAYKFRDSFKSNLDKSMPTEEAGIVMAMLWGDESGISKATSQIYQKAGLSHILVLSGYNLSILIATSALLFSKMSFKKKVFGSVIFILSFLLIAKTGVSVWRAVFMSFYVLAATLFMKDINIKFLVWICAFMFCLFSPRTAMFDISFHLSMIATIGIVFFQESIKSLLSEKFPDYIKDIFSVALSASFAVMPYLIYQFAYFNLFGLFVSTVVSLFVPVIMLSAFLAGVFGYISIVFAQIIAYPAFVLTSSLSFLANMSAESGSLVSHPISFYAMCLLYLLIFLLYFILTSYSVYKR